MPFVREDLGSRTSGRGDYTVIVDGSGRFFLAGTGGHIQLFRRFVTPWQRIFCSHGTIVILPCRVAPVVQAF
jgi:hypothetical protein